MCCNKAQEEECGECVWWSGGWQQQASNQLHMPSPGALRGARLLAAVGGRGGSGVVAIKTPIRNLNFISLFIRSFERSNQTRTPGIGVRIDSFWNVSLAGGFPLLLARSSRFALGV